MYSELDVISCNFSNEQVPLLRVGSSFEDISKAYLAIVLSEEKAFLSGVALERKMEVEDVRSLLGIPRTRGMECGKCKASNVYYVVVAKRSADEGMLSQCMCRVCGHQWTMRS